MGHAHAHPRPDAKHLKLGRSFALATALNVLFVGVEAAYGLLANSTALLADAAHNLSDVLGLLLAWGAARLSQRSPTSTYTYGLGRSTVLAALVNASLLFFAVGAVAWEAVGRLNTLEPIPGKTVLWVAGVGVLVNGLSAALFVKDAEHDVNVRGALLHLLADAAVSMGVVLVGMILIWRPGWLWLDPIVGLSISAVVVFSAVQLLREALHLSVDGVPQHVDIDRVKHCLHETPGVAAVHDLHVWALSTSYVALTAHVVIDESAPSDLAVVLAKKLKEQCGIDHSTIQLDTPEQATDCKSC